ncbi:MULTISPECIES: hypothetical protein [unclassified Nostoc]|uniref:hypothetical protein n=1 Tax=unclassified Nostoc TaxID=2593658 RepID=UPI000A79ECC8|nr:hypothetical protein [Nostoc sp. KVJ20]
MKKYVRLIAEKRQEIDKLGGLFRKPDNNKEVFAPGEFADFSKPNDTAKQS